jgi:hypothetical protein
LPKTEPWLREIKLPGYKTEPWLKEIKLNPGSGSFFAKKTKPWLREIKLPRCHVTKN